MLEEKAIIRQRGQITIPETIRGRVPWLKENSMITISQKNQSEIVIRPLGAANGNQTDWSKVWRMINLARSFKGKRGNLSSFIAKDRFSH